jgi:sulfur carrier protein ThiS
MMSRRPITLSIAVAACAVCFATSPASADPAADRALAANLFDRGVARMKSGDCGTAPTKDRALCREALDDFHRAFALYPTGVGALKNAAFVEKALGMLASADRDFRELARITKDDPRPQRRLWADLARREIDELAARIPRLRLEVGNPPEDLAIELDGKVVPKAAWGTEIPVDPGSHAIVWRSRDLEHSATVDLAEGESKGVAIVVEAKVAPAPRPKTPAPILVASPRPDAPDPRPSRTGPFVLIGTGAAAIGAGLVFGALAWDGRRSSCDDAKVCDPDGLDRARTQATVANVAVGSGLALAAAGGLWLLLGRSSREVAIAPSVGQGDLGLRARITF